jgi:hypothetical protein
VRATERLRRGPPDLHYELLVSRLEERRLVHGLSEGNAVLRRLLELEVPELHDGIGE